MSEFSIMYEAWPTIRCWARHRHITLRHNASKGMLAKTTASIFARPMLTIVEIPPVFLFYACTPSLAMRFGE